MPRLHTWRARNVATAPPSSGAPMSAGLFWYPWIPRDFLASTRDWSLSQRAVYRELLDAQWDSGGLPDDAAALRALARATPAEWRAAWPRVDPKFPLGADGLRRNLRLEGHRARSEREHARKRQGAEQTNAKRWGNASLSDSLSDRARPSLSDTASESLSVSHLDQDQESKRLTKGSSVYSLEAKRLRAGGEA